MVVLASGFVAATSSSWSPSGAISMDRARTVEEGVMEPYVTGEVIAVQSAASVVPYVPPPPPGARLHSWQ